jgi:hypothetical protein
MLLLCCCCCFMRKLLSLLWFCMRAGVIEW